MPRRRIEEPDDVERAIEKVFETERRDLADGVRHKRQALGWTQQRLAEESRLSVIYVSHLELARANVNPTLRALSSLAHALDCRVGELAGANGVAETRTEEEAYRRTPRPASGPDSIARPSRPGMTGTPLPGRTRTTARTVAGRVSPARKAPVKKR